MHIDHIVVSVGNLERSASFYDALFGELGFEQPDRYVYRNSQGIAFVLDQAKDPEYLYRREGIGVNHIGVQAESLERVEAVARAMEQKGFTVPAIQQIDGVYALFMKDADGMRVEVSYHPSASPES